MIFDINEHACLPPNGMCGTVIIKTRTTLRNVSVILHLSVLGVILNLPINTDILYFHFLERPWRTFKKNVFFQQYAHLCWVLKVERQICGKNTNQLETHCTAASQPQSTTSQLPHTSFWFSTFRTSGSSIFALFIPALLTPPFLFLLQVSHGSPAQEKALHSRRILFSLPV